MGDWLTEAQLRGWGVPIDVRDTDGEGVGEGDKEAESRGVEKELPVSATLIDSMEFWGAPVSF